MVVPFQMVSQSIWLVIIKEDLVVALLVPGDVVPHVLSLVTISSALPQLSLVVLEFPWQWTL